MSIKTKGLKAYPTEIPSREEVLEALAEAGVPVPEEDLVRQLSVHGASEREGFERRLAAMERDGEVLRNRRGALLLPDKAGLIKGKVIGHPDGFGFLKPEDGRDDLFLGPKQMHKVLHGDVVLARVTGVDRRGRLEGSIVEVLERANNKVVGRLFIEHGVAFVIAENKRINQDILIMPESLKGASVGQVVVAELVEQPTRNAEPIGRVVEVLGNYADPGMEIEIALRKHDLPHEWPRDALEAARRLPKTVAAKDLKGRRDLREPALRDHRRRDREGFRRRGVLREEAEGVQALGGDRRREPLRAAGRSARPRGVQPRQLGLLPAPRDPDAAGGAVQRAVLAEARRGPPRDGVRDGGELGRRGAPLRVLSRSDPFPRAHDLHEGRRDDRGPGGAAGPRSTTCTACSRRCSARARSAAPSISRPSRRR